LAAKSFCSHLWNKKNKRCTIVYVADPGIGLISYTQQEFCENWFSTSLKGENKGVALLLETTTQFFQQDGEVTSHKSYCPFS